VSNYSEFRPSEAFPEPAVAEIDLISVLKALADPARLHIVQRLSDGEYHPCNVGEYDLTIHKSTLSHHFKTLREAGITSTAVSGREHAVRLRRGDLDVRFPGVLTSILLAHRRTDVTPAGK
jgi:DNA-binding transcriptional ArsR family regulator